MNYLPMIGFIAFIALFTWIMMIPAKKRQKRLNRVSVMVDEKVQEFF